MGWAFHLSQELQDIYFQTYTKDFQSNGNKLAEDISHLWEIAFSLLFCVKSPLRFNQRIGIIQICEVLMQ